MDKTFSAFDFGMGIQAGQTKNILLHIKWCALTHVLYIKSPFNLIVSKENVLNLWIRLLTFSVSKCHTSVEKEAVTSNLFHHFSEA